MFSKIKHGFVDYIDFFLPTQSDVLDPICSSKNICIWSLRANLEVRRTVCATYQLGGSGNLISENSNWTALVRHLLVIVKRRNPMIGINVDKVLYPEFPAIFSLFRKKVSAHNEMKINFPNYAPYIS